MATTSLQRRVRLGGRLRLGRGLRARSRLRVGPHALAKGMLEGLPYVAILLLLRFLLLVLFLILLFIFLLCASRLSTRQSKVDGTLAVDAQDVNRCTQDVMAQLRMPGFLREEALQEAWVAALDPRGK